MREEKKAKRESCEELSRLYAAGEMSPAQAADFEAHLAGCDACKEQVREWEELFSILSSPAYDGARLEPRPDFDKPVMAFVRNLIGERRRAAELAERAAAAAARATEQAKRAPSWDQRAPIAAPAAPSAGLRPAALDRRAPIDSRVEVSERIAQLAARASDQIRRRAIWVGITAIAAVLVIFSDMLSRFSPGGAEYGRPYVVAITWVLGAFHKSFDWLVFSFFRSIKIGEVFILIFEKLRPIWNGLGVAARQLDPQLVVMEVLLLMLSLVLMRGFLGTAPKGRCTNVGIII